MFAAMAAIGIAVSACSVPERAPAVPRADTERALPLGIANARFYPDSDPQPMIADATEALQREMAALPPGAKLPKGRPFPFPLPFVMAPVRFWLPVVEAEAVPRPTANATPAIATAAAMASTPLSQRPLERRFGAGAAACPGCGWAW